LSKAQLERLKFELKQIMKPEEDSIIIYTFRTRHYFSREVMGRKKGDPDEIFV